MDPDVFLAQTDIHLLVQALTTLALDVDAADSRKDLLTNAGILLDWRSKFTFGASAYLFANKLAAHFREYRVSEEQPTYHPMIRLLEYLLNTYTLEDLDRRLFTKLIRQGQDNFGGLRARRAIGRIKSPPGSAIGTGVLIDKQHMLTGEHVFERIRESGQNQAWVRFGYKRGRYGVEMGKVLELEMNNLVSHESEPDYAFVRVLGQPDAPAMPVFIGLPRALQDVRLIHHPQGAPAEISEVGQVVSSNTGYIHHTIQTEYGSSGGAIVDLNWHLVAIHRGIPLLNGPLEPGITEGVPLYRIWDTLKPHFSLT